LNISRRENIAFQVIIFRYLHERFLYRLSISKYANSFMLKGGNLLYALDGLKARPTIDVDFLGVNIQNELETIKDVFTVICDLKSDDAVWFDVSTIEAEEITEQEKYSGVRLHIDAGFDTVRQRIQVDIGFGDVIVPEAQQIKYPVLLEESGTPLLSAYSVETIIAEKFQAMIELSTLNSRMKDFWDVYNLLKSSKINTQILEEAVKATFKNRGTSYVNDHALFSSGFKEDETGKKMWHAFLNKINTETKLDFEEVMQEITNTLKPIWERLK